MNYKRILSLVVGCFLTVSLTSSISHPREGIIVCNKACLVAHIKKLDYLLFLLQKRAAAMHEVARWKWSHHRPIEESLYEERILSEFLSLCEAKGMDLQWSEVFFKKQLEAADRIQREDFAQWSQEEPGSFEEVLDLYVQLRPYLSELSEEIVQALYEIIENLPYITSFLPPSPLHLRESDYISQDIWEIIILPLRDSSAI